ncbi:MAG: Asp-tRNA(Asn)/Glu-tRNA(Gln) amidotransferase subunit GatA [Patescibacteria group bacterium UBA2163]
MDVTTLNAVELAKGYRKGDFTVRSVVQAYLDKIEKENHKFNVYLEVFNDVLEAADRADAILQKEGANAHVLCGVPIAVKDNILIEGKIASAASKMLENHVATYDATAIDRLKKTGAVFLGRTNMDEFAMGTSTEHSAFGPTKNPIDPTRVPGGSSGGSAAAVSALLAPIALGTDTGGSVRQPASLCGVYGFKPTYGGISRFGLIAMGSSLDQLGVITRNVSDIEEVFSVVKGHDKNDATSLPSVGDMPVKNKKIGVPRAFIADAEPDVVEEFEKSLEVLKEKGYEIVDIELPIIGHALAAYYIIMPAEVSTNLTRFDGVRYGLHLEGDNLLDEYKKTRAAGFGAETRRRIVLGTYLLSSGYAEAYYHRATALRSTLVKDLDAIFEDVAYIATPTAPRPAFKVGEKQDPVSLYLEDVFTVSANLAGIPAISVPHAQVARDGVQLPVGIQFMSQKRTEQALFSIARDLMGEEA